jgi:hypothetical protein
MHPDEDVGIAICKARSAFVIRVLFIAFLGDRNELAAINTLFRVTFS